MHVLGLPALGRAAPAAPVIARLIVGLIMAANGWGKLTEMSPAGFSGMLEGLGVPAPLVAAWLVTSIELGGGLLLIVGALTRIAALLNAGVLLGALVLVKADIGLIAPMGADMPGAQLDLAILGGLLVVALLGPGRPSVDHLLRIERTRPVLTDRPSDREPTLTA